MMSHYLSPLAALALIAAPAAAQEKAPAPRPAAAPNWAATVTLGPNGAYVIGNPNAPRLVEYLSYTCSHCADFQREGLAGLNGLKMQWIRRGILSLEVRNFVRDPYDLAAALLARCGGPARFLASHEALFLNQNAWFALIAPYEQGEGANPPDDRVAAITRAAEKTGLLALLAKQGLTPAAQRACLADKQAMSDVLGMTANAWDVPGFSGTPYFILNGKPLANVHNWAALRPLLPQLPAAGK